jgi:hypothetical protein
MLITRLCCLSRKEARLMLRKTFDRVTTKTVTNFTAVYATCNSSPIALEHMNPMSIAGIQYGIHDVAMKKENLLYIYIPKTGSTTMKATLSANASDLRWQSEFT